jgi:aspartate kinase
VIDVISTSEVSVALTLDNSESVEKVVADLSRLGEVEVEKGFAVICVVGEGLRASTGLAAKIFSTIEDVNVALVSHGASAVNLDVRRKRNRRARTLSGKLHQEFF